ncbi:phage head-tail connector protein [Brucella abortus]|nr:phage head-tail connector protein [Brucella abortus]
MTIADARAFLRISTESEDDILGRLITTARELVEAETGLALIDQTWRLRVDRWRVRAVWRCSNIRSKR